MPSIYHLQQYYQPGEDRPSPNRHQSCTDVGDLHHLKGLLQFQIEYILRNANIPDDSDNAGWMPVGEIIGSKRIHAISKDADVIMEAIEDSPQFELDPHLDMLRLRRIGTEDRSKPRHSHASSLGTMGESTQTSQATEDAQSGYKVRLCQEDMQVLNLKALTNKTKRVRPFLVPKVMPFELVFFRKVFSLMCEAQSIATDQDELPVQAFQRAFERFFRLLRDPRGFNSREYDQDGNGYVGWGEFFYVFQNRAIVIHLNILERVFLTLDDPEESKLGTLVSAFVLIMIAISSMGFILSTVPALQIAPGVPLPIFDTLEVVCLSIFCGEYLSRLLTVWIVRHELFDRPKLMRMVVENDPIRLSTPISRLWRFLTQPTNVIDLAAILPPFIGLILPEADSSSFVVLRLIRLTRIFRAFRNPKLAEPVIVIGRTLSQSTKALYVLAFNLMLGILISSSLMWWAEKGTWDDDLHTYVRRIGQKWNSTTGKFDEIDQESPFTSIPQSFWWAIVTACTVGYGDQVPVTTLGYSVASATMLFSLVILALPVGVIGGNFSSVWQHFDAEKKKEAAQSKRDMDSLTNAIQFIAPATMRNIIVVEVWNDRLPIEEVQSEAGEVPERNPEGVFGRPDPAEFMGEAKLELDFLPTESLHVTRTLKLESNPGLVRRSISGSITLELEWTPRPSEQKKGAVLRVRSTLSSTLAIQAPGEFSELLGTLKVTLHHGEKLINLNWKSEKSLSNPYCTVTCYPEAPSEGKEVPPHVWRSPTALNSLNPKWDSPFSYFEFTWTQEKYWNQEVNCQPKSPKSKELEHRRQSKIALDHFREAEQRRIEKEASPPKKYSSVRPSFVSMRSGSRMSSKESLATRLRDASTPSRIMDAQTPTRTLVRRTSARLVEAPMLDPYTLKVLENFAVNVQRASDDVQFFKTASEMEASIRSAAIAAESSLRTPKAIDLPGMPDSDSRRQSEGSVDESFLQELMV